MKTVNFIILLVLFFTLWCCKDAKKNVEKNKDTALSFIERLERVSDSIKVEDIVVKNIFKSQILAHQNKVFDSLMIVEKVYKPHQQLWDHCYGMIFGEDNAAKFNTPEGMIGWNKTLYPDNKAFFNDRAESLLRMNLDSTIQANLDQFNTLVPYKVESTISILFTPITGILFGGCTNHQFCIELNYEEQDITYTIENGLPHELNHLAYEPLRVNDPDRNTALRQMIDEGFACYFTWVFFDNKISKHRAVENMSDKEWHWYLNNEKALFNKLSPYFNDESGDNPLMRNDKYKFFPEAPKSLNYWLGFRIIEKYVEKHGEESWKDIYEMNVQDVLNQSDYKTFIDHLE